MAAATRRAALRPGHAGRLRAHRGGLDQLGADREALRDRPRHRQRQRGAVQQRGQHARPDGRLPDDRLEILLRANRAGLVGEGARGARRDGVTAGMEHDAAGVAGLDAALDEAEAEL